MVATKACFAPSPPTIPRNSFCKSLVEKKSVSSRRGQNLFWWVASHAAGATRVSPIRRTSDRAPRRALLLGRGATRVSPIATDRRHSCRRWWPRRRASLPHHPPSQETASASRWWALKAVSSRRCQNLFWWVASHAAGATRVSPIRRTSDRAPRRALLLGRGVTRVSPIRRTGDTPVADGGHEGVLRSPPLTIPRTRFCKSLVGLESCFFPSGPKLVLVGGLLKNSL